jgi:transposase-like protein
MAEVICKRCHAAEYVKNGKVRGLQRYRCQRCACNFTATAPRGKPAALKAMTLLLYAMGNVSYRMIGRVLDTSHGEHLPLDTRGGGEIARTERARRGQGGAVSRRRESVVSYER